MSKKRKSTFRDKIEKQVQKHKEESSGRAYGYLNIPKGIDVFTVDIPKNKDSLKVNLDILPYIVSDPKHPDVGEGAEVGELWWRRPIKVHRNVGIDNESVICLTTFGKKCPICDYRKDMMANNKDKDDIKALSPSKRSIYIVIPVASKDFDETMHIFDIPDFCFYDPLMIDVEEEEEYEFPSLEDGKTLAIRFNKESYAGNSFSKAIRISFNDREEVYDESILDDVPNLDEILIVLSYEELEKKFLEIDEDEDNEKNTHSERKGKTIKRKSQKDDESDDESKHTKKRRITRPKSRKSEEDEESDEGDKPKKGKDKCPHGYKYGVDTDKYDECETCNVWVDCDEEKENNE